MHWGMGETIPSRRKEIWATGGKWEGHKVTPRGVTFTRGMPEGGLAKEYHKGRRLLAMSWDRNHLEKQRGGRGRKAPKKASRFCREGSWQRKAKEKRPVDCA